MKKLIITFIISFLSISSWADDGLKSTLLERVDTAKRTLQETQATINQQHKKLAVQMQQQLATIQTLRAKAKSIQKVEDEQLLSLSELQQQVKVSQEQQYYQMQLASSFAEQINQSPLHTQNKGIDFKFVKAYVSTKLLPAWENEKIVDTHNQLRRFETIKLGPISIALAENHAGYVNHSFNNAFASLETEHTSPDFFENISELRSDGKASILFDPTLGNAKKLKIKEQSIGDYVQQGGTWAYPILFFALLAAATAILKVIQFVKLPALDTSTFQNLKKVVATGDSIQITSFVNKQNTIHKELITIAKNNPVSQLRDDMLISVLNGTKYRNEKFLGIITTCAAISPLLGLLGTVSGMIHTFMMMNIFGSGDASVVSGGISQALITTELGLIVAIPALIMSALLNKVTKSYQTKLEHFATQLSKAEFTVRGI